MDYYYYSFNYLNGRRAIQGDYQTSRQDAEKMAAKLSKEKGRVIVLKGVTLVYGRYGNTNMATSQKYTDLATFQNGKRRVR